MTDTLFGALGALGSAQATMNNLTFGNAAYQYYETICSGAPAGSGFDGASGVHTHMTNSRLTDPEILESRFPVVLEDFHIRRGSGGKGQWRAGDGTLRRVRFLRPMQAAILSGFRVTASIAIVLLVAAEMIGADRGIGAFVLSAGNLYDTDNLLAGIVVLSLLGLAVAWVIGLLERMLLAWR